MKLLFDENLSPKIVRLVPIVFSTALMCGTVVSWVRRMRACGAASGTLAGAGRMPTLPGTWTLGALGAARDVIATGVFVSTP
jgi:hypothetical protein